TSAAGKPRGNLLLRHPLARRTRSETADISRSSRDAGEIPPPPSRPRAHRGTTRDVGEARAGTREEERRGRDHREEKDVLLRAATIEGMAEGESAQRAGADHRRLESVDALIEGN